MFDETELPRGTSFDAVQKAERAEIQKRRKRYGEESTENLAGLAISGGGIRVGTFALGAIQALAAYEEEDGLEKVASGDGTLVSSEHASDSNTGLLGAFDYLSTVSGGSFIGSWLTSWIYRKSSTRASIVSS